MTLISFTGCDDDDDESLDEVELLLAAEVLGGGMAPLGHGPCQVQVYPGSGADVGADPGIGPHSAGGQVIGHGH